MSADIGIWTVRKEARPLAQFLASQLSGNIPENLDTDTSSNREQFVKLYPGYSAWILIMTTGIAVRYLQGLMENKKDDPGVVVLDEAARFAVALIGGHEGGANALAYRVANLLGAVPVVTTATEALKPLVLGIGCRKGVSADQIETAVCRVLREKNRQLSEIREVATVDLKQYESGLLAWCQTHKLPLRAIARETIAQRAWVTQPSAWVQETLSLDGVCEPAALIASPRGHLLQTKIAHDGVTVALVEDISQGEKS